MKQGKYNVPNGSVTQLQTFLINSISEKLHFPREEFTVEINNIFFSNQQYPDRRMNCLFFLHSSSTKFCPLAI